MHYPHKTSKVKLARKLGFRARMRTRGPADDRPHAAPDEKSKSSNSPIG